MAWRGIFTLLRRDSSSLSDAEIAVCDVCEVHKHNSKHSFQTLITSSSTIHEPQKRNSVTFSTVEVRYYNRVLGDNPSCDFPLSLGWRHESSKPVPVNDFDRRHESDSLYVNAKHLSPTDVQYRKQLFCHIAGFSETQLRREERRRRLQLIQEVFCSSNASADASAACDLPRCADILIPRYLCERRNRQWR